jgi:hypothetical protein
VGAKTVWVLYDLCEMDTRSPLVVEDFIKDLGYEIAGRVKVYWLRSGKGC